MRRKTSDTAFVQGFFDDKAVTAVSIQNRHFVCIATTIEQQLNLVGYPLGLSTFRRKQLWTDNCSSRWYTPTGNHFLLNALSGQSRNEMARMIHNNRMRPPVLLKHVASGIWKLQGQFAHQARKCALRLVNRLIFVAGKEQIVLRQCQKPTKKICCCSAVLILIDQNKIVLILVSRPNIRIVGNQLSAETNHVIAVDLVTLLKLIFISLIDFRNDFIDVALGTFLDVLRRYQVCLVQGDEG